MTYELKTFNIDVSFIQSGIDPTRVFERYRSGSDLKIKESYGEAGYIYRQIKAQLDGLFSSGHANDPMLVAEAMVQLVQAAPGQHPIRIPVDPAAGAITEHVNSAHAETYRSFLQA